MYYEQSYKTITNVNKYVLFNYFHVFYFIIE